MDIDATADAVPFDRTLGAPYTAETIPFPDDFEGPVVATLVKLASPIPTTRAVLHIHGFADYFFQVEYAQWWADRGYDFYALDLRKYGRSLLPHQTPNYVADLSDHYPEIDAAWERITRRDGHVHVVASGHSTGGLTLPLWADDRRPAELTGMFLNSPWFDMQGSAALRVLGTRVVKQLGKVRPLREIPRTVSGFYAKSLHARYDGEWEFNNEWKPIESFPVTMGWLRAVRNGHARLHQGLDVAVPVLVLSSGASGHPTEMGDLVHTTDIVLDVAQIRHWATAVGRHVGYAAIEGGRHDLVLSLPDARSRVYEELHTWLRAYVER